MRLRCRHCSILVSLLILIAGSGGCGGGGDSSNGTGLARIEGRVTGVVAPGGQLAARRSTLVAPGEIDGIRVEARAFDRTLATDTTDASGNFVLEFAGPGDVDLVFLTEGFTLRLGVVALPGSVVRIAVELRPVQDEVVVVDPEDGISAPLRCQTGALAILDDDLDLVVDGRGEDCLRVQGNCDVEIVARSITFRNCESCIRTAGNSRTIAVATTGPVFCEADQVGVRSEGTSSVEIETFDDLLLDSSEFGIRAQGNANIAVSARGTCRVASFDPIRIDGNASVDTAGCGAIELIGD